MPSPEPDRCRSADAPCLDEAALARLRQLDPDGSRGFLSQVLRTYCTTLQRHLVTLDEAGHSGALRQVGEVAHTLKSSSASVGALVLSQHCATVETMARAGDAAGLGAPLKALQAEATLVLSTVRDMLDD